MIRAANLTGSVSRSAGGLFESVRRLVQSLSQTGIDLRVFGTADQFTSSDIAAWEPVPVSVFKPVWPESFGYSPDFGKELARFAPTVAHTHGIWQYPSLATNKYCAARNCPYVISPHGMLDPWAVRHSRWKKALAYFLYEGSHLRRARCMRALCEAEARALRKLGLTNQIAIIPNGIDLPLRSHSINGKQSAARARKVLLYLGRIHPKKGLVNLLRAWKQANAHSPEWLLAIAGWDQGGHERELKRLATELELNWQDRSRESGVRSQEPGSGARSVSSTCFSVVPDSA